MNRIIDEIQNRNIKRLCHFTRSNKLLHIMRSEDGIIANTFLDDQIEILEKNDSLRLDGKEDYVCCSVQYPNTWYLDKIKDNDPLFKEWVILFIDPMLMLDSDTLFCHRNAASDRGNNLRSGFVGMFENRVQGQRLMYRSKNMPACSPTDDQAEVLIYKNIPRSSIQAIVVPDEKQAKRESTRLSMLNVPEVDIVIASDLFTRRWSNMIRNGQTPKEISFREE